MLNKQALYEKLVDDLDCSAAMAKQLVPQIMKLPEDLFAAFEEWFYSGKVPNLAVEGYTIADLQTIKPGLTVVGAFLTLEWIRRDKMRAIASLNQKEVLGTAAGRKY